MLEARCGRPLSCARHSTEAFRMSILHAPKTRWGASLAHLLLSILIIGSIALFAFV